MSWYNTPTLPVESRTIFGCRNVTELIELLDYKEINGTNVVPGGHVLVETLNDNRHEVQIYCSAGREVKEYYGVFNTFYNEYMFLDCYRLGYFDGDPNVHHPYNKDELQNLTRMIYELFVNQPHRFAKRQTCYYLKPCAERWAFVDKG